MPCEHLQPIELMQLAEKHLKDKGLPRENWNGYQFKYTENVDFAGHRCIVTYVAFKENKWVVMNIDRRSETCDKQETGLKVVTEP